MAEPPDVGIYEREIEAREQADKELRSELEAYRTAVRMCIAAGHLDAGKWEEAFVFYRKFLTK